MQKILTIPARIAFAYVLLCLCCATSSYAQLTWDGSTVSTTNTSTSEPKVGIGTSSPAGSLHIATGYGYNPGFGGSVGGGPYVPPSFSGIPALKIFWEQPGTYAYGASLGGSSVAPNIIEVIGHPTASNYPYYFRLNPTGIALFDNPAGGSYRFGVNGISYFGNNMQVAKKLAVGTTAPYNSSNWASYNFPYTFQVDSGDANFNGNVSVGGNVRMANDSDILLRGNNGDLNHGLGWYSNGGPKRWNNQNIDGPVLYGYDGGALGTNRFGTYNTALRWTSNGQVFIGKTRPSGYLSGINCDTFRLGVDGDFFCKRAIVQTTNWADFVFDDSYQLQNLSDVESYIKANNHLPGIPSEKDVLAKGVDVTEMNKLLLQKVEELTLYIIEMDKKMKQYEKDAQTRK